MAVIAPPARLLGESGGNFILTASHQPLPWADLEGRLDARGGRELAWWDDAARDFADDGIVLRDDYAPVDQLLGRP